MNILAVLSVRLSDQELKRLEILAKGEGKEKSSLARELIMDGLKYKKILAYKEAKISLSRLSKTLGLSLSEAIDLLTSIGIAAPINYDDYLIGIETMRKAGSE